MEMHQILGWLFYREFGQRSDVAQKPKKRVAAPKRACRARNAPGTVTILNGRCWKVSNEFPGIFSGYHVSARISAGDLRASC